MTESNLLNNLKINFKYSIKNLFNLSDLCKSINIKITYIIDIN